MGSFSALLFCCLLAVTHAAFLTNFAGAATRPRHPPIVCAEKPTDSAGNPIKAALSPYMHFCAERRPSLTAELKASMGADFKNTLVMSSLGAEWKKLGDGDKAKFAQVAAADKQRYDTAFASNPANANLSKKKRAKKAPSDGPKKLSAYMHFCASRRPSLTAELKASMGDAFKMPAVMSALGAEWKQLGDAEKAKFQALAAQPVQ